MAVVFLDNIMSITLITLLFLLNLKLATHGTGNMLVTYLSTKS